MSGRARVLLADDEPLIRLALSDKLSSAGYSVTAVATGKDALAQIETTQFDVAVLDLELPDLSGIDVLRRLVQTGASTDVVMITAHGTVPTAVEAMKLGARDFLTKPFESAALLEVVDRYVRVREARRESLVLPRAEPIFHGIVGDCAPIRELIRVVLAVSESDAPILIQGETGTGKELVARAIHASSARREAAFVVVSCALAGESGRPGDLFCADRESMSGPLQAAMGGTLFLDEVADLPAAAQVRLLQALQGAGRVSERSPDVRVVGATRVDLRARMEQGAFRDDLFYRLNVLPVVVPPLRERGEDVQLLADYFLWQLSDGTGRPPRRLSAAARNALKTYAWPGNVRELQNAITRAVTLCPGDCIDVEHLALGSRPSVAPLASSLRAEERRRIDEALARTGGRKAEAAELLGISRKTLWEKLKRRNTS